MTEFDWLQAAAIQTLFAVIAAVVSTIAIFWVFRRIPWCQQLVWPGHDELTSAEARLRLELDMKHEQDNPLIGALTLAMAIRHAAAIIAAAMIFTSLFWALSPLVGAP